MSMTELSKLNIPCRKASGAHSLIECMCEFPIRYQLLVLYYCSSCDHMRSRLLEGGDGEGGWHKDARERERRRVVGEERTAQIRPNSKG